MSQYERTLLLKHARRAGQPARYERAGVSLDVERGKVWLFLTDGDVLSIEAPRLGHLLAHYEDKLRESGLRAITSDGYPRSTGIPSASSESAELEPPGVAQPGGRDEDTGVLDGAELRARARSLDAQLQALAGDCEDLLADLRDVVLAGDRTIDPVGVFDARLDRICFELVTVGTVLGAVTATHADAEDSADAGPWWHADLQERTHMDLRRWLDRCLREGLRELQLRDLPSGIRETEGDKLLMASDGVQTVERVLRVAEQEWLLACWPSELREPDDAAGRGGARGRLT